MKRLLLSAIASRGRRGVGAALLCVAGCGAPGASRRPEPLPTPDRFSATINESTPFPYSAGAAVELSNRWPLEHHSALAPVLLYVSSRAKSGSVGWQAQIPLSLDVGQALGERRSIHTGPLVAGYVGSSKAMGYTVIGDTANTSARLCGIALAGQIIVSESTLSRLGSRFEVEELPPAHLKGKEKPLRIFNVKREKPSAVAKMG